MGNKKNSKSYEIALAGIACAIAVTFLSLGILSGVLLATGYFVGILALMIPLAKQYYKGGFLAYLGTCILTVIMGAAAKFWELVPFVMFFGLHPLINSLQIRFKVNRWLAYIIKALWFDCTLIAGYFLIYEGVIGGDLLPAEIYDIVNRYIYLIIFTAGTALFFVYDYLVFKCQIIINQLVFRIVK